MNRIAILMSAAAAALIFVGCKPTEKNYKAAYDAALAKREAAVKEQMLPASGMLSDDGPQLRMLHGDSIFVLRDRLRKESGERFDGKWIVTVGMYKMSTNARAMADDLRAKGLTGADVARASGGRFFTVAAEASSLDSAAMAAKDFRSRFPGFSYIGLPGSPVLVNN